MANVPKVLYKYLKPCRGEVFLVRPQLRFTNFVNLDDVLEVVPGQRPLTRHELAKIAAHDAKITGRSIEECRKNALAHSESPWWGRALRDKFKNGPPILCITCLTERWDSDGMWAIYADNHRGLVFGVHTESLPKRIGAWGKVRYRRNRPLLPTQETAYARVRLLKVLEKAAFTKSLNWEHQKEWRATSATEGSQAIDPPAVAEIIIGYEASQELEKLALGFKELSPSTRVFRAYPHPQKYIMKRKELLSVTKPDAFNR